MGVRVWDDFHRRAKMMPMSQYRTGFEMGPDHGAVSRARLGLTVFGGVV